MQFDTQVKTNFTVKGKPLETYTLVREDKLAHLNKISEISSLHLIGLNIGEMVALFQRRGPYMVVRPRNATLH